MYRRETEQVLTERRRVLRTGGRCCFVEHVAAEPKTFTRLLQRLVRRPWAEVFEGCSCERDLETVIRTAGFETVDTVRY
ncbi:MAG: Methyltransferase type 11 [Solirubrobacteraceae bacterium]|nr:Methyltransferase type 11 [Solirubrobacteraceae bacterium]